MKSKWKKNLYIFHHTKVQNLLLNNVGLVLSHCFTAESVGPLCQINFCAWSLFLPILVSKGTAITLANDLMPES